MATSSLTCKLFYNLSGVSGGTWVEIPTVEDVKPGTTGDRVEASGRSKWEKSIPGRLKFEPEFTMIVDHAAAAYTALRDAWINRTKIGIRIADGAASSGLPYIQGECYVFEFDVEQSGTDPVRVNVKCGLTDTAVDPTVGVM